MPSCSSRGWVSAGHGQLPESFCRPTRSCTCPTVCQCVLSWCTERRRSRPLNHGAHGGYRALLEGWGTARHGQLPESFCPPTHVPLCACLCYVGVQSGDIGGPSTMEHMVDTVLFLEAEVSGQYRFLRVIKNRNGDSGAGWSQRWLLLWMRTKRLCL